MSLSTLVRGVLGRRGLGYVRDLPDERDRQLASMALPDIPPVAVDHSRFVADVLDQGPTNSCVAHAWCQAIRLSQALDGVSQELTSRLAVYWLARAESGDQGSDGGTYLRSAAKAITRFGLAPERVWPFELGKVNRALPWSVYRAAHDRRGPRGYYRIVPGDLNGIRRAVAAKKPVVFGMVVGASFVEDVGPTTIDRDSGAILGGHALCVVGYDAHRFRIVNSWGTHWRDRGFAWLTDERMRTATDVWAADFDPAR